LLTNNADDQYELAGYALSATPLNVPGTSVANCLTALKAVTPLATAKLHGHAGLKGKSSRAVCLDDWQEISRVFPGTQAPRNDMADSH
jgi:hypothetical protein